MTTADLDFWLDNCGEVRVDPGFGRVWMFDKCLRGGGVFECFGVFSKLDIEDFGERFVPHT